MKLTFSGYYVLSGTTVCGLAVSLLGKVLGFASSSLSLVETVSLVSACVGLISSMMLVRMMTSRLEGGEFSLKEALENVKKLTKVIDRSFDGIVLTDARGVIRHVNPQWEKITGWSAAEAEGKMTPAVLKSGFHDSAFYTNLWLTIQNGKTFRGEIINKCKDGSFYRADEIVLPLKDAQGRNTGYAAFHHVLDAKYQPTKPPARV